MTKCFRGVFPHWNDIDIEYYWRGTIVYTRDWTPSVGSLEDDPSVYFSYGYSANGNNTTVYCGKKLSELIFASNSGEVNLPAIYKGLSPKFPFAFHDDFGGLDLCFHITDISNKISANYKLQALSI